MVPEEDSKPHFLDCLLNRESVIVCLLPVCRKPTHTDRYLHLSHHHIQYNKELKWLYQRARSVTNVSESLKEEEKHLNKVIQSNGYDNATIRAVSKE